MPTLDVSELNIVLGVLGSFIILYGIVSAKIKRRWYLGEALPAVVIGIALGPLSAKFVHSGRWGSAEPGQTNAITLGVTRVIIGVQLVIAGFQLPAKYPWQRWRELLICLIPIMTLQWLSTTACILATVPNLSLLSALVMSSCVTCTDPILSQAIAKGPFADNYVRRPLREIISAEGGANNGFGFPFLMLATYLMRCTQGSGTGEDEAGRMDALESPGRDGGGVGEAIKSWVVDTWLYTVLMSVAYGIVVGYLLCKAIRFALKREWVEDESYFLLPTSLGLFIVGTCGAIGTDDLLACFVAGCALNWDGHYLHGNEERHDEVNSSIDMLLNLGGFMHIGTIIPWDDLAATDETGLTVGRLFGLGALVLFLRRIPAVLAMYRLMPGVCRDYKEALFMGYFGPIGAGAVFYVETALMQFPKLGEGDDEETALVKALSPVVYWLVFFSIVVHGLSIPALSVAYWAFGVKPIHEDAVEIQRVASLQPRPVNSCQMGRNRFLVYNRFSQPNLQLALRQADMLSEEESEDGVTVEEEREEEKRRKLKRQRRMISVV